MRISASVMAAWCLLHGDAAAQQPVVVQLPTIRYFSVDTTVSVPAGGSAQLGGVRYSRQASVRRGAPWVGPLGSRQVYASRAAGWASVHVTPIFLNEPEPAAPGRAAAGAAPRFRAPLEMHGARPIRDPAGVARRVAEIHDQQQAVMAMQSGRRRP